MHSLNQKYWMFDSQSAISNDKYIKMYFYIELTDGDDNEASIKVLSHHNTILQQNV